MGLEAPFQGLDQLDQLGLSLYCSVVGRQAMDL
jgi:hypothetical protein